MRIDIKAELELAESLNNARLALHEATVSLKRSSDRQIKAAKQVKAA